MPVILELNVYPVKSCRGFSLQSVPVTPAPLHPKSVQQGLLFDREWVVVRADNGKFLTQRQIPRMALIETSLPPGAFSGEASALPLDAALVLNAPGQPPLHIPLPHPDLANPLRKVTVWEWTGGALDEGEEAAAWFSTYLGTPSRLVRYVGKGSALSASQEVAAATPAAAAADNDILPTSRSTDQAFANGYHTRFADGFPMLLASEASLFDLNTKLAVALPMNRFRPNVVVSGSIPWAEDTWRTVDFTPPGNDAAGAAGALQMTACKPCGRCKVTTINQLTAEVGDEPLDTLGDIRSGTGLGWALPDKTWKHKVFFGWNTVTRSSGVLSVGDEMSVLQLQSPMVDFPPA